MIKNIFFDWYKGDEYNDTFGQITYCDEYDNKIDVHNLDGINEKTFYAIYTSQKTYNKKVGIHYNYL